LCAILATRGWRVREAANGRLAVDAVAAELPDVILLDIMMPEMHGFEPVAALQAKQRPLGADPDRRYRARRDGGRSEAARLRRQAKADGKNRLGRAGI